MSMRINSQAIGGQNLLRSTNRHKESMDRSLEKLSSGRRINRAADDAAGLALANKLGEAIKGLEQGMRNADDGYSLVQVADGGLGQVQEHLGRMRELAMTASNATLSEQQRSSVQQEFDALQSEVNRISGSTEFNGKQLLDGSAGSVEISVGQSGSEIALDLSASADSASLGLAETRVDGADGSQAVSALADIDAAMAQVSAQRADLGAGTNRLTSAHRNLAIQAENAYASQSRVQDLDWAAEAATKARNQILTQTSTALMAQGRGLSPNVLNLLK